LLLKEEIHMSQLFHLAYRVEPRSDGWTVVFGHMEAGRFKSRRDALYSARRDASFCRSLGNDVTLQARRRDGGLCHIRIPPWDQVCASPRAPICGSKRSSTPV
jgi:hypothetical protein